MLFFYMNPILITAAVVPAIILLVKVYQADKLEKEPAGLLLSLVMYGVIATGFAAAAERLGSFILGLHFAADSLAYNILLYFVVVAISEEGFKYLLLKWRTWRSPFSTASSMVLSMLFSYLLGLHFGKISATSSGMALVQR